MGDHQNCLMAADFWLLRFEFPWIPPTKSRAALELAHIDDFTWRDLWHPFAS